MIAKRIPEHFPQRNGLISSWSQKLLVVEAANKSGALSTAQFAKDLSRDILVPPHEIYCTSGQGTNHLLKNGATLYLKPEQLNLRDLIEKQILTRTNKTSGQVANAAVNHSQNQMDRKLMADEAKILGVLMDTEKTIQQLEVLSGMNQVLLIEQLVIMELEGLVALSSSGRYRLVD